MCFYLIQVSYGKVKRVRQTESTLLFGYDAQQNRLKKQVTKTNCGVQTDYYIRDAQGNVLSVYRKGVLKECQSESFVWQEQHLYGSSRLGLAEVGRNMLGEFSAGDKFSLYKGAKRYELTNHLGNVLSVVSDKIDHNGEAQVISAKDYYPFGMSMPSRTTEGGTYRYGFNGKERDTELGESVYTAEFWQYSANLGRRWNIDPIVKQGRSTYSCFNNNPTINIDPQGNDDFFDANGNFIRRIENGTHFIKIIKSGHIFETAQKDASLTFLLTSLNYKKEELNIDYNANINLLTNVVNYYASMPELAINGLVSAEEVKVSGAALFTEPNTPGKPVKVAIDSYGKINEVLTQVYDLSSSLYHEGLHQKLPDSYKPFEHGEIVLDEMKLPFFDKTTPSFKASRVAYIKTFIDKMLKYPKFDNKEIQTLIEETNKFKEVTGFTLELFDDATTIDMLPYQK